MPYLLEGSIYWSVTIKTHRLCHLNWPNNQRCLSKQNFSGLQVTSCGYIFSELFRLPYLNQNIDIIHYKLDEFITVLSSFFLKFTLQGRLLQSNLCVFQCFFWQSRLQQNTALHAVHLFSATFVHTGHSPASVSSSSSTTPIILSRTMNQFLCVVICFDRDLDAFKACNA